MHFIYIVTATAATYCLVKNNIEISINNKEKCNKLTQKNTVL
jgi:hypothetical protein